jgi:hypothetical protein
MPYFSLHPSERKSNDNSAVLGQDCHPIITANIAESFSRDLIITASPHRHDVPYLFRISALDAAWLGTQLLQLAARADDLADEKE